MSNREKDPGDTATSVPSTTATRTPGTNLSDGPSTHRNLYVSPIWISPPSNAYSAINHLGSPGLGNLRTYNQSLIRSRRVRGSGTQHTNIFNVQYDITNIMLMSEEPPLPYIPRTERMALHPGHLTKTYLQKNELPDSLVRSPLSVKLIQSCINSSSLHNTVFIPHSMSLCSSPTTHQFLLSPQSLVQ